MKPDNIEELGKAYEKMALYFRTVVAVINTLPVPPFYETVPMGPELRNRRKLCGREYRIAKMGKTKLLALIWAPNDTVLEIPTFEEWVAAFRRDPDIYEAMPAEKYLAKKGKNHGTSQEEGRTTASA